MELLNPKAIIQYFSHIALIRIASDHAWGSDEDGLSGTIELDSVATTPNSYYHVWVSGVVTGMWIPSRMC